MADVRPQRDSFGRRELAIVLSHYDIGAVSSIHEFERGSSCSPKVVIRAGDGRYLLKRRAPDRSDPFRVAFSHTVQLGLAARGFPTPAIIGTKRENNSMLQKSGHVYELFRFIEGSDFGRTPEESRDAGATLARLHGLCAELDTPTAPSGSYHDSGRVREAIAGAERRAGSFKLREVYDRAADAARTITDAEAVLGHGDYHPGNLVFREGRVAAVLDFDQARLSPRVVDLASAALHLSLEPGRLEIDEARFGACVGGYAESGAPPTGLEYLPALVVESLIAEAAEPIAKTGGFGTIDGRTFLEAVTRGVGGIERGVRSALDRISL